MTNADAVASSETPLRATFKISLNGKTVAIGTVGHAYRFITNLSSIEWIEFKSLHAGNAVRFGLRLLEFTAWKRAVEGQD